MTKARRRDFELQSSELWGNKNHLSAQLQIQLIGFKPNLSHFSFLKSLHQKKHVFRTFWGLSGGRRSRFYKKLCTRVSLQNAAHDKSHPETRSLCAFCRVVVPTHPSTNTALYYKMLLESEPTPLLQNAIGVFDGGSKANVGHYKMVTQTGCSEKS